MRPDPGSDARLAVECIRYILKESPELTLDEAASAFARDCPRMAERVLSKLGDWPASPKELAALQVVRGVF
jgi:hypothetical protein